MMRPATISLAQMLRRGHRKATLWAVLIAGLAAGVASALVLRDQVARNLHLIARTAAYSVEVAVAFRDPEATQEIIAGVLRRERVASIEVVLPDGQTLARASSPPPGLLSERLGTALSALMPLQSTVGVERHGQALARVRIVGDGSQFVALLLLNVVGSLAAVALTAAVSSTISRRLERHILGPIDAMRQFTRAVRAKRSFALRAPAQGLEDIDALGEDFNALLEEVETRESRLLTRQARLQRRYQDLSHAAWHDTLTGLANRAGFDRRLAAAFRQAGPETRFAVLFIDADELKATNDRLGHAAGDRLLVELATRLRQATRTDDFVARIGGDEFAVLMEDLRLVEHAQLLMRKIERAVDAPAADGSSAPRASVGAAVYPEHGLTPEALLRHADQEMYESKRRRRPAVRTDKGG
jgi:diguanylate cyclase (GGDEF)-like protein